MVSSLFQVDSNKNQKKTVEEDLESQRIQTLCSLVVNEHVRIMKVIRVMTVMNIRVVI